VIHCLSREMSENLILEIVEDEEEDLPKSQEELSSSKFDEITCRTVTSSSVVVQWIYLNQNLNHDVVVFKVLKLETRGEWKSVAWTRKTICQIENLEQNVCYSLKIHVLVEDETEFRVIDESEVFKVNT
jgi:16S rRNA G527 N7-methylase RsmG